MVMDIPLKQTLGKVTYSATTKPLAIGVQISPVSWKHYLWLGLQPSPSKTWGQSKVVSVTFEHWPTSSS